MRTRRRSRAALLALALAGAGVAVPTQLGAPATTPRPVTAPLPSAALPAPPGSPAVVPVSSSPTAPVPGAGPASEDPAGWTSERRAYLFASRVVSSYCDLDPALLAAMREVARHPAAVTAAPDTDAGEIDGSVATDVPVGPLGFSVPVWRAAKVDADGDGERDPLDLGDAALSAAVVVCSAGRSAARTGLRTMWDEPRYVEAVLAWRAVTSTWSWSDLPTTAPVAPSAPSLPVGAAHGTTIHVRAAAQHVRPKRPVPVPASEPTRPAAPAAEPAPTPVPVPASEPALVSAPVPAPEPVTTPTSAPEPSPEPAPERAPYPSPGPGPDPAESSACPRTDGTDGPAALEPPEDTAPVPSGSAEVRCEVPVEEPVTD